MPAIRDPKTGRFVKAASVVKPSVPTPAQLAARLAAKRAPIVPAQPDRRANGYKGALTRAELATQRVPTTAELRSRRTAGR